MKSDHRLVGANVTKVYCTFIVKFSTNLSFYLDFAYIKTYSKWRCFGRYFSSHCGNYKTPISAKRSRN